MDDQKLFEEIIDGLLGIELHVFQQNQTPEATIEYPHPEIIMSYGLSFPKARDIGAAWERNVTEEQRIFPAFWQLALYFCRWFRTTGGLSRCQPKQQQKW